MRWACMKMLGGVMFTYDPCTGCVCIVVFSGAILCYSTSPYAVSRPMIALHAGKKKLKMNIREALSAGRNFVYERTGDDHPLDFMNDNHALLKAKDYTVVVAYTLVTMENLQVQKSG